MEKKQLRSRKVVQTGTNKKMIASQKRSTLNQPVKKSATPNVETQDSNKAKPKGLFGSLMKGYIFWEIVIPLGIILFSIVFFITQWILSLFVKNALEVIWLTVSVFGIGGATTGWLLKRAKTSAVIGAVIGIILALACVTFIDNSAYLTRLGPCILGC